MHDRESNDAGGERENDDHIHDALENALKPFGPEDMDLEDKLAAIPEDANDMLQQMLNIIDIHISEIYSPPRLTMLAAEHGLSPGMAFDIMINDATG